jgi:mono/diheme cytochrome c family protein
MTRNFLSGLSAVCLALLGGCQAGPNVAFPTAQTLSGATAGQGGDISTLERGRKIYTTSCTECHVARTIAHYSPAQWQHYVGIMAPRAGLKPSDRAALEAYLLAARASMPAG